MAFRAAVPILRRSGRQRNGKLEYRLRVGTLQANLQRCSGAVTEKYCPAVYPHMAVFYCLHPGLTRVGAHGNQCVVYGPVVLTGDDDNNFIVSLTGRRRPHLNGNVERSPFTHADLRFVHAIAARRQSGNRKRERKPCPPAGPATSICFSR